MIPFFEVSAKTGHNVHEALVQMTKLAIENEAKQSKMSKEMALNAEEDEKDTYGLTLE